MLDEYRFFLEYLASFSAYLKYNKNVYIVIEPLLSVSIDLFRSFLEYLASFSAYFKYNQCVYIVIGPFLWVSIDLFRSFLEEIVPEPKGCACQGVSACVHVCACVWVWVRLCVCACVCMCVCVLRSATAHIVSRFFCKSPLTLFFLCV